MQTGSDASLQRIVIAERDCRGRILAVKHLERAAGPQHAVDLHERPLWSWDVRESGVEDDDVERVIAEWERSSIGFLEGHVGKVGSQSLHLPDQRCRRVAADDRFDVKPACKYPRQHARFAAHLQDMRPWARLNVRKKGGSHGQLLRVRASRFEDAGKALLRR